MAFVNTGATAFIYTFHMPLFFLISGYLYKRKDNFGEGVKKDAKRLLLPYVYFYIISYAYWFMVIYSKHKGQFPGPFTQVVIIKPMLGMLFGMGYETNISRSINHPLWFLVALFFIKVIYTALEGIVRENRIYVGIGILILLIPVVFLRANGYDLWFSLDSAVIALPFFYFGTVIRSLNVKLWFKNNILNMVYFVALTALTFLIVKYNGNPDINSALWGNNLLLFYIGGLAGTFMIFSLCFVLAGVPSKFILFVSANTLVLMCIQGMLKSISMSILKVAHFNLPLKQNFTQTAVLTAVIFILSLPVMYLIDKYLPFLAGIVTTKNKAEVVSV